MRNQRFHYVSPASEHTLSVGFASKEERKEFYRRDVFLRVFDKTGTGGGGRTVAGTDSMVLPRPIFEGSLSRQSCIDPPGYVSLSSSRSLFA